MSGSGRAAAGQAALLAGLLALCWWVADNAATNLAERGIRTGFAFLLEEAGFDIGETLIAYRPADSYGRAFLAGLANTLRVALVGVVLASILGLVIGLGRLSGNWLAAKLATIYVETVRNVPLLLQLFLWYALLTGALPSGRAAINPIDGVYLNSGGLRFPGPVYDPAHGWMLAALLVGFVIAWAVRRWARARDVAMPAGRAALLAGGIILALPLAVFLFAGAPFALDMPEWYRFRYRGGVELTPEFLALVMGLVIYTAAFIAEIVRAGVLGVPAGQSEAARALGLSQGQTLRLVVLPQALRIIVPPLTSQYLNLVKNSSLAVAIGYPDLVSVANTSLNQTGQAIELIAMIMAVYLTISLAIAAFMNWYNRRVALIER